MYFQWWEKKCKCGEDDPKKGIVQIFEEDKDIHMGDLYTTKPFKLKIPICMGALISSMHVLTTKFCFGYLKLYEKQVEIDGESWEVPYLKYKEKGSIPHSIKNKKNCLGTHKFN